MALLPTDPWLRQQIAEHDERRRRLYVDSPLRWSSHTVEALRQTEIAEKAAQLRARRRDARKLRPVARGDTD